MKWKIPKAIEKPLLVGVILLNCVVLYFVFQRLTHKVQANTPFKYGDTAPVLEGITTIDGEEIKIPNEEKKLTVLLFFGASSEIQMSYISEMIFLEGFHERDAQFIGIFQGSEIDAQNVYKTHILPFPLLADPRSRIHRKFRIFSSQSGGILALDRNSIVRLYNVGLLRPEFLKDFLNRYTSEENFEP